MIALRTFRTLSVQFPSPRTFPLLSVWFTFGNCFCISRNRVEVSLYLWPMSCPPLFGYLMPDSFWKGVVGEVTGVGRGKAMGRRKIHHKCDVCSPCLTGCLHMPDNVIRHSVPHLQFLLPNPLDQPRLCLKWLYDLDFDFNATQLAVAALGKSP